MPSSPRSEELTREQCVELLAAGGLGRVAVSSGALPAVYSVFYSLDEDYIVVRLAPTWALRKELDQAVVAFNVDRSADDARTGWSVMVRGRGEEVCDPELAARLRCLPLPSWSDPAEDDTFVRIELAKVSGTRFDA
jgi:uncharacterized protein